MQWKSGNPGSFEQDVGENESLLKVTIAVLFIRLLGSPRARSDFVCATIFLCTHTHMYLWSSCVPTSDMPAMTAGTHTHKKMVCLIFRRLAELFVLVVEIIDWICCRLFCLLSLSVWVGASGLTVSDQLVSYMYFLFSLSRSKKSSKKRNRRVDGNCEYMILIVSTCNVTNWLQWNSHSRWFGIWRKLSHHPSLELSRHMRMPEAENFLGLCQICFQWCACQWEKKRLRDFSCHINSFIPRM